MSVLIGLKFSDLMFSGCYFTWSNKREDVAFVAQKVDRILANEAWMGRSGKTLEFLEGGVLDHSTAVVIVGKMQSYGPRPFKFFSFWTENEIFLHWVEEGWRLCIAGVPMFQLVSKLKAVKHVLKQ